VDSDRIAMSGFSAGSVMALLVGTTPEDPGTSGSSGKPSHIRAVVSNCGALPRNDTITHGDAATLFIHGTADGVIPIAWARSNRDAMSAVDVPAFVDELRGAGHCPNWDQYRTRTIDQSKHFLYYLMDLANADR
jgi:dienelactone hydrolase